MPRYDYRCDNCQRVQEVQHPYNDNALPYINCECSPAPQPCTRLIGAAPVHYDGWGFYLKDNLPAIERHAYKHEAMSGTQSDERERSRRIQDPHGEY